MADPATFRQTFPLAGPPWLVREGESLLVGYSLGLVLDACAERARQALLARLPTTAPDDALPAIGRDRRVVRGINESSSSYVTRLLRWLDDRKTAGNPFALLERLAEYTGPGPAFRTVDNRGNWFSRDANGARSFLLNRGNWDWDGEAAKWSRFWVVIYPLGLWTDGGTFDDGSVYGTPGTTIGTTATPEQVQTIRALVGDWKPGGSRCVNIIIALDPASFDPTAEVDATGMPNGLWGRWSKNVGGVQVPARLASARYWDGV